MRLRAVEQHPAEMVSDQTGHRRQHDAERFNEPLGSCRVVERAGAEWLADVGVEQLHRVLDGRAGRGVVRSCEIEECIERQAGAEQRGGATNDLGVGRGEAILTVDPPRDEQLGVDDRGEHLGGYADASREFVDGQELFVTIGALGRGDCGRERCVRGVEFTQHHAFDERERESVATQIADPFEPFDVRVAVDPDPADLVRRIEQTSLLIEANGVDRRRGPLGEFLDAQFQGHARIVGVITPMMTNWRCRLTVNWRCRTGGELALPSWRCRHRTTRLDSHVAAGSKIPTMRMAIGEFAAAGRVSVRTLRHYDDIGLLRPAAVDPRTSYRFYERAQLERLHSIVALKDLGFGLDQVAAMLAHSITAGELRGMLRLRRVELEHEIGQHQRRLADVEARLRNIEQEHDMSEHQIEVKSVAAMHVASTGALAASFDPDDITAVIGPLYPRLFDQLGASGVTPTGPSLAWYEVDPMGTDQVLVHAGVPVDDSVTAVDGLDVIDLPAIERVAAIVHQGAPEAEVGFDASYHALLRFAEANGYVAVGFSREIYLDCPPDRSKWVTELQFALAPAP